MVPMLVAWSSLKFTYSLLGLLRLIPIPVQVPYCISIFHDSARNALDTGTYTGTGLAGGTGIQARYDTGYTS
jgi:hypothetical protein